LFDCGLSGSLSGALPFVRGLVPSPRLSWGDDYEGASYFVMQGVGCSDGLRDAVFVDHPDLRFSVGCLLILEDDAFGSELIGQLLRVLAEVESARVLQKCLACWVFFG
jgi:hypothetical protein